MLSPGEAGSTSPRPNHFGKKTMACVSWDQSVIVYCELLKPGEIVNAQHYRQQMINLNYALIERRAEWARRYDKVILSNENAPSHTEKLVKNTFWNRLVGTSYLTHRTRQIWHYLTTPS
ncbi:mariner Mos1 transposase [Trichonephila clavata]|uniref:Mariner Mos1 transposase n=1 Tax=Trichonephila clavata TaxID=2740835 RepID=A0A8X6EZN5_TRICU|nr:mariner Mos1 transposase [Trichonephila clavata]